MTEPSRIYILEQDCNNDFRVSHWKKVLLTEERWYEIYDTSYDFAWTNDTDWHDPNLSYLKSSSVEEFKLKAQVLDLPCYVDEPSLLKASNRYAEVIAFKQEHLDKMARVN